MSAGLFNLPLSPFQDKIRDGAFNLAPLVTFAHNTTGHTLKVYFGGFSNTSLSAAKIYFESLDGTVTDNHTLTLNADTTSGTYTSTNTDAWMVPTATTFKIWVQGTLINTDVNLSFPAGNARQLISTDTIEITTT